MGRANAGGTTTAVRKMRCRLGLARPSRSGGARGQGLACVEGHRGRVCFPCGGGSRLGCVVPGASWGRRDGICAPVQAKFQKLSRKPSKGSLCGAVSACEQRWQSGVKVEVFIVGGDL